mgnify:CR=1 FL=1|jgi:hypothetical protein
MSEFMQSVIAMGYNVCVTARESHVLDGELDDVQYGRVIVELPNGWCLIHFESGNIASVPQSTIWG